MKIKGSHTIGDEIKAIREFLGWSQVKLANEAQITPAAVSQIEKGTREPAVGSVIRIASALGVTTDRILLGKKR